MARFKLMRTDSRNLLESPGKTVDTAEPQNLRRLRYRHVEVDQKFSGPGNPAALMKSPWRYPISLTKKFAEVGRAQVGFTRYGFQVKRLFIMGTQPSRRVTYPAIDTCSGRHAVQLPGKAPPEIAKTFRTKPVQKRYGDNVPGKFAAVEDRVSEVLSHQAVRSID